MLAERFDPLRARLFDLDQLPPVRVMAGRGRDVDRFAAERVRDKNALPLDERDAIAEMADMIDDEAFNHGARP
jgi:hypothetical protein